ncbi:blue copper protein-like [Amaranthus tricolor]|uniref:blue copper protein-like n=1 Tax=Amaranthus tricolor TaxID=29722 RepID=UPI0025851580|nr:blue copper protein-like [Amaranthus tricolor]
MAGKNEAVLLTVTMVIATLIGICSAATYTVGGNTGWTIPSQPNFYSNWASQQTFQVGDALVFNFAAGAHTVGQVNKANFDACGTTNTIGQIQTTSPATITLTTAGTHYFICTLPGHCGANQKLSVVVTGSSATTPASAPAPAPARKVISPVSAPTTPASAPTPVSGVSTPAAAPTPSIVAPTPFSEAPTPTSGALTPATAPTPFGRASTPTGGAPTPTSEATGSPPVPDTVPLSPSGSPTTPAPSSPAGNFGSSTGVSLLSLVSVVIAAFMM